MKKKLLYPLLIGEAVLCAAAAFIIPPEAGGIAGVMQAPFAQTGALLRGLSLPGGAGNAAAFVIYIIICCVPAGFLVLRLVKKRAKAEDILLAAMSGYLFYLMYMMINPAKMGSVSMGQEAFGKAVLGGVFWSLLIGWLVLKLLRFVKGKDTDSILKMLGVLFALAAVIIVFSAAYIGTAGLNADIAALKAGNTVDSDITFPDAFPGGMSIGADISPTITFLVFRFIVGLIPVVTDILILLAAKRLAERLYEDRYGTDVIGISEKLARLCRYAVAIAVLSTIALNVIQLLAAGSLRSMSFISIIPLGSVILALAVLLLSRYFMQSRKLKQENEAFV